MLLLLLLFPTAFLFIGSFLTEQRKVCHHWKNDDETHTSSREWENKVYLILAHFWQMPLITFKDGKESLLNYLINLFFLPAGKETRDAAAATSFQRDVSIRTRKADEMHVQRDLSTHTVPAK